MMQCPDCATTLPDEDVSCVHCGRRLCRSELDHIEQAVSPHFAAVSDRGLRHDRNEDRFAIASAAGRHAIVVCDGVSSSHHSETASKIVSEGILEQLRNCAPFLSLPDPATEMRKVIAAGVLKLAMQPQKPGDDNPPSTTVVAALVEGSRVVVGWVGDSRAYWIDAAGARQLTQDHSWTNAVVAAGQMTFQEAEQSPQAHAITRWIGADAGSAAIADVACFALPGPGILLLCTDGLWNYASTLTQIAALVAAADAASPDALTAAGRLVSFANGQGGHDNVTVAWLRF
jgi:serine/threonine protein phosphatase PrpC